MKKNAIWNETKYNYVRNLVNLKKNGLISEEEFKMKLRNYMAIWLSNEFLGALTIVLGSMDIKALRDV